MVAEPGAAAAGGTAAAYASSTSPETTGLSKDRATAAARAASHGDEAEEEAPDGSAADTRPWLFHTVMALGGLYLAMLLTNWGDAGAAPPRARLAHTAAATHCATPSCLRLELCDGKL